MPTAPTRRPSPPLIIRSPPCPLLHAWHAARVKAISDINLDVARGEIVGILGHTGSGKSTAIQHLNGLMRAHEGTVDVLGQDLRDPQVDVRALRRRVGLVFQLPEAQLFEQYVGDDVAYGPRKLGLDKLRSARTRAQRHGKP